MTAVMTLKPYLLRAVYQWCVAQGFTPMLTVKNVVTNSLPRFLMDEEEMEMVALNISPQAVRELDITDDDVDFQARFHGVVYKVSLPMANVLSIVAREKAVGINFDDMDIVTAPMGWGGEQPEASPPTPPTSPPPFKRPHLTLVK